MIFERESLFLFPLQIAVKIENINYLNSFNRYKISTILQTRYFPQLFIPKSLRDQK